MRAAVRPVARADSELRLTMARPNLQSALEPPDTLESAGRRVICYGAVPSLTTLATMRCQTTLRLCPLGAVLGSRYSSTMHTNYPDTSVSDAPSISSSLSFQSPPNCQDGALTQFRKPSVINSLRKMHTFKAF